MRSKYRCIALLGFVATTLAMGAGDAQRGAQLFRQCTPCHSTEPGEHFTGPSLANVWNRRAATIEGFHRNSDALKRANVTWNAESLDKWLADPERMVPGTSMAFPGIKQSQAREDIVAYLRAAAEKRAPVVAQRAGGMTRMMGGGKTDLRMAPPEGQISAIRQCGDTYTIDTADGRSQKIWEFNLRLKTDSSKLGPAPGRPVVIGAGMQGDRASVVFASPKEISEAIKQDCP